jgi:hypothetical protein
VAGGHQVDAGRQKGQRHHDAVRQAARVQLHVAAVERVDPVQFLLDHRPGLFVGLGVHL